MRNVSETGKQLRKDSLRLVSRVSAIKKHNQNIENLEQQIIELRTQESELSKRAKNLEKRNLRLEELNQIKDEFIGIASHQLRTPATGVKQYIDLLLDGFADELTPNQRIFLERAHESNDRQLRIIDDLLRVARIDSESYKLHRANSDVNELLNIIVGDLKTKVKKRKQSIVFKEQKRKVMTSIDSDRLRMALENILDNAISYSGENTKIIVSVKSYPKEVQIIIKDQGVGIDKSDYSKLFQKFSRIPNPLSIEVGGTGLGLYWANKIVKLHSGIIDVKSEVGKGSTFTVIIPKNKK